jgi:molybdopterin converting factor small subunit
LARVVFAAGLRGVTAGVESVEIAARDVRELLRALYRRWPALEARLAQGTAIAIDGEVIPHADALHESLGPNTEIHFLPQIGGG